MRRRCSRQRDDQFLPPRRGSSNAAYLGAHASSDCDICSRHYRDGYKLAGAGNFNAGSDSVPTTDTIPRGYSNRGTGADIRSVVFRYSYKHAYVNQRGPVTPYQHRYLNEHAPPNGYQYAGPACN